jgi:hypothetical protein
MTADFRDALQLMFTATLYSRDLLYHTFMASYSSLTEKVYTSSPSELPTMRPSGCTFDLCIFCMVDGSRFFLTNENETKL